LRVGFFSSTFNKASEATQNTIINKSSGRVCSKVRLYYVEININKYRKYIIQTIQVKISKAALAADRRVVSFEIPSTIVENAKSRLPLNSPIFSID
jgi:hypothetical protein